MSSTEETVEARSTTEEREGGRWRPFTAAAKREWQRDSSTLVCRVLDMSFFITATMSATSQGGATETACITTRRTKTTIVSVLTFCWLSPESCSEDG